MKKSCEFCNHEYICMSLIKMQELIKDSIYSEEHYKNVNKFLAESCEYYNIQSKHIITELSKDK